MALGTIVILGLLAIVVAAVLSMADPTIPTPQDEQLRLQAAVTKTADFDGAALDLGSGYAPGGVGKPVSAVINVTAGTRADSDETYAFNLQQSADASTWETIGSVSVTVATTVFATGVYLAKGLSTKRYKRLQLDVAGTTPSITYEAWLNPLAP